MKAILISIVIVVPVYILGTYLDVVQQRLVVRLVESLF
jgi:hypothetical protein